jgi:nitrite reductase/ring-hydroxylating ferredoxin subunit
MLSTEDNELITRVGPGTPMGNLMREYWVPAMLSSELPGPDCDPLRVMLLGERLVAFRNSDGKVGLLPHNCPHKKASLFFGRNEEGGIRCVFHGWKFAVDGTCMDMPNEPPGSKFKDKVRAKAYPCIEKAGVIWTYMGPREEPPELPGLEIFDGPEEATVATAYQVECNWLQAAENDLDITHFGFLHGGHGSHEDSPEGSALRELLRDRAPRYKVVDTAAGVMCGSYRPMTDGETTSWYLQDYLFPWYSLTGVGIGVGENVHHGWVQKRSAVLIKVPMDDTHTMAIVISVGLNKASENGNDFFGTKLYTENPLMPNSGDWFGRFRWIANKGNDYLIDRDKQRNKVNYTGLDNVILEDSMMTESMGDIVDRSDEHLGVADTFQIRIRRRLLAAAKALAADGTTPPGVDEPRGYHVRPGYVELPNGSDLLDAAELLRRGTGTDKMPEIVERPWELDRV